VLHKLGGVAFRHVEGPVADVGGLVEDQPLLAGEQVGDPVAALAELRAAGAVGKQAPLGLHVGTRKVLAFGQVVGGVVFGGRLGGPRRSDSQEEGDKSETTKHGDW